MTAWTRRLNFTYIHLVLPLLSKPDDVERLIKLEARAWGQRVVQSTKLNRRERRYAGRAVRLARRLARWEKLSTYDVLTGRASEARMVYG